MIQNKQAATDTLRTMSSLNLHWEEHKPHIFFLQSSLRNTKRSMAAMSEEDKHAYEHASFWTHIPSRDWQTQADGNLSVRYAMFQYALPMTDEVVDEEYNKDDGSLQKFIDDFWERYELPPHLESAKEDLQKAIRNAFKEKRAKKQAEKDLLEGDGYDQTGLEAIQTVKVYPSNIIPLHSYVNKYYGKAHHVYPAASS